jgi:hypothetical protein
VSRVVVCLKLNSRQEVAGVFLNMMVGWRARLSGGGRRV